MTTQTEVNMRTWETVGDDDDDPDGGDGDE